MTSTARATVLVAGIGSEYRHDDAVGSVVAARAAAATERARDIGPFSEPLDLLNRWNGVDLVIVIDATSSGVTPGTVRVVELDLRPPGGDDATASPRESSSHGIGLAGVVRLARAAGQMPRRLVVVGVEGERFDIGEGLSGSVAAAVPEAVSQVVELIVGVDSCV
jgi:hydrogenase maturation protease